MNNLDLNKIKSAIREKISSYADSTLDSREMAIKIITENSREIESLKNELLIRSVVKLINDVAPKINESNDQGILFAKFELNMPLFIRIPGVGRKNIAHLTNAEAKIYLEMIEKPKNKTEKEKLIIDKLREITNVSTNDDALFLDTIKRFK